MYLFKIFDLRKTFVNLPAKCVFFKLIRLYGLVIFNFIHFFNFQKIKLYFNSQSPLHLYECLFSPLMSLQENPSL